MDCGSCDTVPARPDRPHTFLAHEPSVCPGCASTREARLVLRRGQAWHLIRCPQCGPQERLVAEDGEGYRAALVARGLAAAASPDEQLFKTTTSTCPTCLGLVPADVVIVDNKVYFSKTCAACGPSRALVSEDAEYYVNAYSYAKAGTQPFSYPKKAEAGCPTDCGLCDDHEQHTCLPIVEVTDHCNLACPICIVDNQYSQHMDVEAFRALVDGLVAREGQLESVALSGGEPTSHPRILDLIDAADRPEVSRVVVITNGLRLGRDRAFAQALKDRGAYVGLQLDSLEAEPNRLIRGRDLVAQKWAAIRTLQELDIPTQVIFVATRGVNEHELGRLITLFLEVDCFISLNLQPAAYTGQGGGTFAHDPMDRLTIPGVIRRIEEQTGGMLAKKDFFPLPCSHPQCVSLTYLLKLDDGTAMPFPRFIDFTRHMELLRSSAVLPATRDVQDALQDAMYEVFANQDTLPKADLLLAAMRRSLDVMFPERTLTPKEAARVGERQAKSIFLHHYMDRHDFDLERLRKCCHHYPQADGRVMPACGFNMFHRGAATGGDRSKAARAVEGQ